MQPTFLPWAGYFHLISSADTFVFLENIPLSKQSWQTRNRILLENKKHWLSVPLESRTLSQKICEVKLNSTLNWREKHLSTLKHAYAKKPFGHKVISLISDIYNLPLTHLADLNIALIKAISQELKLDTSFYRASELGIEGQRTDRLITICQHFDSDTYLSPQGAKDYISEDQSFDKSTINLQYQHFEPKNYFQGYQQDYVPYLSVIDLIANVGWEASKEYISSQQTLSNTHSIATSPAPLL
ncbi:Uncharacterized protein SCG7109_BC_00070 [Chlamydiales bacterium SCGC AG-110-M15]|nr:Uncharacterized protein SCG7109_BC_00070 [Chlamydiales bacterium SCGC AG-110-M15]